MASEEALVLVVDVNPLFWGSRSLKASTNPQNAANEFYFFNLLEHLMVYINAFTMIQSKKLAVVASGIRRSSFIFPLPGQHIEPESVTIAKELVNFALGLTHATPTGPTVGDATASGTQLSSALSLAMCYLNRHFRGSSLAPGPAAAAPPRGGGLVSGAPTEGPGANKEALRARVLVVAVSQDVPAQYIPLMNAIFSAQKFGVPVDGCMLGGRDSEYLQQAAHVTGGLYALVTGKTFLRAMMSVFLLPYRQHLALPHPDMVDLRPTCFCHKNRIETGCVCSVCLSSPTMGAPVGTGMMGGASMTSPSMSMVMGGAGMAGQPQATASVSATAGYGTHPPQMHSAPIRLGPAGPAAFDSALGPQLQRPRPVRGALPGMGGPGMGGPGMGGPGMGGPGMGGPGMGGPGMGMARAGISFSLSSRGPPPGGPPQVQQ
ncbi:putative transcription factor Tfb4 [Paratrimastix pyriformis]|uniref:Transcription factor Tfb4 n=1 Tax=Paratrimastix pyriformis TaxID=342808 RepID=A0ABQ8UMD5_9EUKA|nr:putative transcription factor Tfb4 [Paratrimastix pyriformis]